MLGTFFFKKLTLRALAIGITTLSVPMFATPAHAQGRWTTKTPLPTAVAESMAGWVQGSLYVVGGAIGNGVVTGANQQYTPKTNSWVTKAAMPTPRDYGGAESISGKLYVVGGCSIDGGCDLHTTATNEAYDPVADSWATEASMPEPLSQFATGVIAGKLYVVGGINSCCAAPPLATLRVYNPKTNAWKKKADMPTARNLAAAGVINGELYVVGGADASGNAIGTLEVYNPITNTWATKSPMPTPRYALGVGVVKVVVGGVVTQLLYAISGTNENGDLLTTNESYNPLTDSWASAAPIPTPRWIPNPRGDNGPGGPLYVAGDGAGDGQNNAITTVEAFKP